MFLSHLQSLLPILIHYVFKFILHRLESKLWFLKPIRIIMVRSFRSLSASWNSLLMRNTDFSASFLIQNTFFLMKSYFTAQSLLCFRLVLHIISPFKASVSCVMERSSPRTFPFGRNVQIKTLEVLEAEFPEYRHLGLRGLGVCLPVRLMLVFRQTAIKTRDCWKCL